MDGYGHYMEKKQRKIFFKKKEKEIVCFECVLYEYYELYKWIKH